MVTVQDILVVVTAVAVDVSDQRVHLGAREEDLAASLSFDGILPRARARAVDKCEELILVEVAFEMIDLGRSVSTRDEDVSARLAAKTEVDAVRRDVHGVAGL